MPGLRVVGVGSVSAGRVGTKDKDGKDKRPEDYSFPCYVSFKGGQLYVPAANGAVHEQVRQAQGQASDVDLTLHIDIDVFKDVPKLKLVGVEMPGGANPGAERPPVARRAGV